MSLIYKYDFELAGTSVPPIGTEDPLLLGSNRGVRFLWDIGKTESYDPGPPSHGKAIRDMAGVSADGVISNISEQLGFAGGGLDYTNVRIRNQGVNVPPSVSADLFSDQEYLIVGYIKFPQIENWLSGGPAGISGALFTACETGSYVSQADIVMVGFSTSTLGIVEARRQTAIGNVSTRALTGCEIHAGKIVQVAFWRNATGAGLRLASDAGVSLSTGAAGSKNVADFSAKGIRFGNFSGLAIGSSNETFNTGVRYYRGFVENLKRSGRNPEDVLNLDYINTMARGAFN